jgi:DDE superfamily endonuclease
VFCVDEKTAIQALDRLDPVLPLLLGRAERHGLECYRHGTLSLYAALDVNTGQVHGMTAGRHTSQEFIAFLEGLVARTKWAREIHVVLDNLSAHKPRIWSASWPSIPKYGFTSPTWRAQDHLGVRLEENTPKQRIAKVIVPRRGCN